MADQICRECGFMHPVTAEGECTIAMAKNDPERYKQFMLEKQLSEVHIKIDGSPSDPFLHHLTNLYNVIKFHISDKKITDVKKLFANLTVLVQKYLEQYKE